MKRKEIQNNKFVIDFNQKTSYGFNGIYHSFFIHKILLEQNDQKSKQLYSRLIRTGIIGDILYKKVNKTNRSKKVEIEFLAGLFESYMFLIRTIYDYLLHFFRKYDVNDNSFNNFLKKIKKGNYNAIDGKLRSFLQRTDIFDEVRSLRDSIKMKTPNISIFIKNIG